MTRTAAASELILPLTDTSWVDSRDSHGTYNSQKEFLRNKIGYIFSKTPQAQNQHLHTNYRLLNKANAAAQAKMCEKLISFFVKYLL